MRLDTDYTNRR